ncbi:hypothetical protein Tco_1495521, partial [Tanacetum coccineum]
LQDEKESTHCSRDDCGASSSARDDEIGTSLSA